jgi:hypothetical protein
VRGGQIAQNFTDNGNGTVTENNTGLTWQQGEPGAMTWVSALSYCEGLSLGDHSDWRLPNIRELESLTDYTRFNPAIDKSFFPNASAAYYWSSTTSAGGPAGAWYVDFFSGGFIYGYKGDGYYVVRCVSGGQSGPSINLTVNLSGVGSGTINNINPDGPAFSCSTPSLSCSALFAAGTSFILHPTPSTNYSFDRWSNGTGSASVCSETGDCSFALSATSSITAKFDPIPLVKVIPSHPDIVYQTLQGAYNVAINNDQLKARNIVFSDTSLTLNRGTNISLKGGLESDFSTVNGYSYLQGILTMISGSLTVENLCIK